MLTVLCPSRGRPDKAAECYRSFLDTRHNTSSRLFFVIDYDDPEFAAYHDGPVDGLWLQTIHPDLAEPRRRGMTDPLNAAAAQFWDDDEVLGFVGDDHRFRTSGWDQIFLDQLRAAEGGLVYANDLNWRDGEIPTQIFGSSAIWKALGWMALPAAQHLYLDNAWRVIGEKLDRLFYFPDIVIEHMHPAYGKAEWDEGYKAVNSSDMYSHDRAAFEAWLEHGAEEDVERVRLALAR